MGGSVSTATRNDDDGPGIPDVEPAGKRRATMGQTTETKWGGVVEGTYTKDHIDKSTSEGTRKRNAERARQTQTAGLDDAMDIHILQVPWSEQEALI